MGDTEKMSQFNENVKVVSMMSYRVLMWLYDYFFVAKKIFSRNYGSNYQSKWHNLCHYGSIHSGKQLLSLFVLMHWLACLCVSMDDSLLHYAILVKLLNWKLWTEHHCKILKGSTSFLPLLADDKLILHVLFAKDS